MDDWSARISPSRDEAVDIRVHFTYVDTSFLDVYGARLIEGRPFRASDTGCTAIINASAQDALGWPTIADQTFEMMASCEVVGVVENYPYASLKTPLKPLVHLYMTGDVAHYNHVSVAIEPGQTAAALAAVQSAWQTVLPEQVFEHAFLTDRLDRLYAIDRTLAQMVGYAALFAFLIAGMGLLGLSALAVAQRRREIGIRRVLGATVSSIVRTLSSDLAVLLLVACVVAAPLAYVLLDAWLQTYVVRVSLEGWSALGIGGSVLVFVLATVAMQAVQAASIDPAATLRSE
jgi:putative ABC transport system permease protein